MNIILVHLYKFFNHQKEQFIIYTRYRRSITNTSSDLRYQSLKQQILEYEVSERRSYEASLGLKSKGDFTKEIYFSDKTKFEDIFNNFYVAHKKWRIASKDPFIGDKEYYEIANESYWRTADFCQAVEDRIAHRIPGGPGPKYTACSIYEETLISNKDRLGDIAAVQEIEPLKGLGHCDIPEGLDFELLIQIFSGLL